MSDDQFTKLFKYMQSEFTVVRQEIAEVKDSFRHLNDTLDVFLKRLDNKY